MIHEFYEELKRRNVFKGALAYVVVSWVVTQVASIVFPAFELGPQWMRYLLIILVVLFPVWLVISWFYEITANGIKKTANVATSESIRGKTSNNLNYVIIGALLVAIVLLAVNTYGTYTNGEDAKETQLVEAIKTDSIASKEKSVAVLAFADMSPEKDQGYFSDGISEEILNYLAKNPELQVTSRTSSFSFKGSNTTVKEIGEKLNVNYVLEGSVRKASKIFRITTQLINTQTGKHLWSETYDRQMDDIFAIQDEIAAEVTKNLEANLLDEKIKKTNTEAYTKYLQAKNLYDRYTKESVSSAYQLINESIEIDSLYAPAWLLKAKITYSGNNWELFESVSSINKNLQYIQTALDLDPNYAVAFAYRAGIYLSQGMYEKARQDLQKALKIDPENAEVLGRVSYYPTISHVERVKLLNKAIKIDPMNELNFLRLARAFLFKREYEKSLEAMDTFLLFAPYGPSEHAVKAELLALTGEYERALTEVALEDDEMSKSYSRTLIALIFKEENKEELVANFKEKYAEKYAYLAAQMFAYQNKKDTAYFWLEKAFEQNSGELVYQLNGDPYMDPLRNDARFKKFKSKIDFPEPLVFDFEN